MGSVNPENKVIILPIDDQGRWDFTVVGKNFPLLHEAVRRGCYNPTYGIIDPEKMKEHGFMTTNQARRLRRATQ